MGVPGSKIWSNLQLLSLFQSKYLKCDDCYDDNDGSQGLRVDTSSGDVITASRKNEISCYSKSKNYSLRSLPFFTISLKSVVLFNIFVSKMEKIWTFDGKVTRCLKRRGGTQWDSSAAHNRLRHSFRSYT